MATDLIEIDPEQPKPEAIERAASAVRRGKVVAIPTDALYSLIADPFNLRAVNRVFFAKGREIHRSLPLLVADITMVEELAKDLSNRFFILARRFWPGPLTLIVTAAEKLPLKSQATRAAWRSGNRNPWWRTRLSRPSTSRLSPPAPTSPAAPPAAAASRCSV